MITFCGSYSVYIPENYISDLSEIKVTYSQDGIASHSEPVYDNGFIKLTFNSLNQGKTEAEIYAIEDDDTQSYYSQFVDLRRLLLSGEFHHVVHCYLTLDGLAYLYLVLVIVVYGLSVNLSV